MAKSVKVYTDAFDYIPFQKGASIPMKGMCAVVPVNGIQTLIRCRYHMYYQHLREEIIRHLERIDPKDRAPVVIYDDGRKSETVYWKDSGFGSGYFCEGKGYSGKNERWLLYKNGGLNKMVAKL